MRYDVYIYNLVVFRLLSNFVYSFTELHNGTSHVKMCIVVGG